MAVINWQGAMWEKMAPAPSRAVRGGTVETTLRPIVDLRAQDYERAAEIIRERGWLKGAAEDSSGQVCAAGAVLWAAVERMGSEEITADQSVMARDMELDYPIVQWWNDRSERTREEVIERLEFAAKKLRNEGRS